MTLTWEILAAIFTIVGIMGGAAVKWITSTVEHEAKSRQLSSAAILQNQADLKDDLKDIHDGFEKRVDRLEQQSREFRSGSSIDQNIEHTKRNVMMAVDSVKQSTDRNAMALDTLRDRVTVVETKHESTAVAVVDLKRELKDTRHEISERFDQMAKTQQGQFDQICASIREMSDRKPKP